MGKVTANLSMSLDGFIAGPNAGPGNPLGDKGDRLHQWVYDLESWRAQQGLAGGQKNQDDEVLRERNANVGAVVMGRGMFDTGEEPWGENPPFHAPVFVLTHHARDVLVREGGTSFTFVTDGLEHAIEQAKVAAGNQDVSIAGGAKIVHQALQAGLLDELQLHLAPVLVGDGIRLFDSRAPEHIELQRLAVVDSHRSPISSSASQGQPLLANDEIDTLIRTTNPAARRRYETGTLTRRHPHRVRPVR